MGKWGLASSATVAHNCIEKDQQSSQDIEVILDQW
jgi:hypothetical protein